MMKRSHEDFVGDNESYCENTSELCNVNQSTPQSKRLQYELSPHDCRSLTIGLRQQPGSSDQKSIENCYADQISSSRIVALTAMVDQCSHLELVHLHETIKPKLKIDFFALLPAELVFCIISYLSLRDILHCAQVSRRWYQVTNDSLLWFRLYEHAGLSGIGRNKSMSLPSRDYRSSCNNCFQLTASDKSTQLPLSADQSVLPEVNWKSLYRAALETQCNWRNGTPWAPVILPAHHNHVITCLEVYNDWAITGSDDASICIWCLVTNRLLISLYGHLGGVWSLVVLPPLPSFDQSDHPTDRIPLLVSGSCDRSARVWLLDGTNWPCITTLYGHQSTVRCVAGQGRGSSDHEATTESVRSHSFGPAGVSDSTGPVASEGDRGTGSVFPGVRLVVTGSRDTTLRLWNARTGQCLQLFQGHRGAVRCVQFFGQIVVSGSYDCTVRLWCIRTGHCVRVLHGHRNRVYTLLFDGLHIISASLDTTIRVWHGASGKLEHTFCGHQSLTSEMAYAAAQRILVSSNADQTIRVWDVASGRCLHVLAGPYQHHSAVTCVQLSRNFIISSSDDGTVKLWDRHSGAYIRDLVCLDGAGRGAVVWRIVASETRLVCAAGSRSGIENTKLIVLRFRESADGADTDGSSSAAASVGPIITSHTCRPKPQPVPPGQIKSNRRVPSVPKR